MPPVPLVETPEQLMQLLPVFLVRCGVAALCGGIIGVERELKDKPAGFRTNILICLGSSIYMATGLIVQGDNVDPTRIAAQVVTGIGFIGAGSIIQAGGHVTGLTTAATIWVVAAIGIVSGAGFPVLAIVAALMVLLTLAALRRVEDRLLSKDDAGDLDANGDAGR